MFTMDEFALQGLGAPQGDQARAQYQDPEARLEERLARLAATDSAEAAEALAGEVRSLWRQRAGPTADLLLQRAETALSAGDVSTAETAYFHLRLLEPEYAEAWVASAELAARRTAAWNSSADTWWEQEKVRSRPPGASRIGRDRSR